MLGDYVTAYKQSSSIKESKFIDPQPGLYVCKCLSGEHKSIAPKDGGRDMEKFTWTFEIIDGECKNLIFQKTEFVSDPEKAETKLGFIKGALERCGVVPPADVRDLPYAMQKCAGAQVEVSVVDSGVKTKDGKVIKNIKITKTIDAETKSHLDNGAFSDNVPASSFDEIPY